MTEDEANVLALRLTAIEFRFGAGMLDLDGRTWGPDLLFRQHPHDRPDLRDPATCGVVIGRAYPELLRAIAVACVAELEARHVAQQG